MQLFEDRWRFTSSQSLERALHTVVAQPYAVARQWHGGSFAAGNPFKEFAIQFHFESMVQPLYV